MKRRPFDVMSWIAERLERGLNIPIKIKGSEDKVGELDIYITKAPESLDGVRQGMGRPWLWISGDASQVHFGFFLDTQEDIVAIGRSVSEPSDVAWPCHVTCELFLGRMTEKELIDAVRDHQGSV